MYLIAVVLRSFGWITAAIGALILLASIAERYSEGNLISVESLQGYAVALAVLLVGLAFVFAGKKAIAMQASPTAQKVAGAIFIVAGCVLLVLNVWSFRYYESFRSLTINERKAFGFGTAAAFALILSGFATLRGETTMFDPASNSGLFAKPNLRSPFPYIFFICAIAAYIGAQYLGIV